jgi:asparagine synthase (glutamine-hydrolysing)
MTNFAGWVGTEQPQEQIQSWLDQMLAGHTGYQIMIDSGHGLATNSTVNHQADRCSLHAVNTGIAAGRLATLMNNYRSRGLAFLKQETQTEALILIDPINHLLLLASDAIGLSNLYYAETANGIVFGSSADFVIRHPDVSNDIAPQTIYDYLYFHHCPSPNTIYRQVKKLEGGQYLVYRNGQITLERYWLPRFQEHMNGNIQQAGQELRDLLVDAVKSRVDNEDNTGAFLSGGLDSSSVTGALAKVFPGKAKTFSMGFPVEGYNEIEFANIAVQHFNTRQHEYYVTPEDTVNAVPLIASYYDEPFGNSSALAAYYCAKLAKENGIKRLLAGDGGDEIFAGNERYAKQMLFEHYHQLPGFVANALETCLNRLPGSLANRTIPFKAKRYIEQAKAGMPDRLQDYNFLHRHDPADIFNGDFLAQVDTLAPLQQLRDCYQTPKEASTLNRMLYLDWKTTLHDNDLVKVNRMCELAGVEVCYPLLDQRIVNLSCRIPSANKLNGQKLRWFYKQAMTGFLPSQIINKSKHGFGLPFGIWLKDHQPLKELAYDAIHNLKKREYFKPEFLDHAIDMHQSVHAAYYGELIWILMMLELWFAGKGR